MLPLQTCMHGMMCCAIQGGVAGSPPPLMPLGRAARMAAVSAPRFWCRCSTGKSTLPTAACSTAPRSALQQQGTAFSAQQLAPDACSSGEE